MVRDDVIMFQRQHTYVIMEKRGNDVTTKVVYCDSSPFGNDYDGTFTPSAALREGGTSYRQQVGGRTITVNADYMDKPYNLSSILVRILRGSCGDLSADTLFQWNTKLSACGDNTTLTEGSPACPNLPCPRFKPQKTSKSTQEACDSFRKCNYVMSACDSSWTQPYDQRPYCACRRALIDDVSNINCPDVGSEGSEGGGGGVCTIPKREIEDFEKMAACYCRYRISRIYPKISPGSTKSVSWEIKATVRTAPIKSYEHCSC